MQNKDIKQNSYLRDEEKDEVHMQRQRRRKKIARICEQEDIDAGRAKEQKLQEDENMKTLM
jgi:hypothetical protein